MKRPLLGSTDYCQCLPSGSNSPNDLSSSTSSAFNKFDKNDAHERIYPRCVYQRRYMDNTDCFKGDTRKRFMSTSNTAVDYVFAIFIILLSITFIHASDAYREMLDEHSQAFDASQFSFADDADLRMYASRLIELMAAVKEELSTRDTLRHADMSRRTRRSSDVPAFLQLSDEDEERAKRRNSSNKYDNMTSAENLLANTSTTVESEWTIVFDQVANITLPPMPPSLQMLNATTLSINMTSTTTTAAATTLTPQLTTTSANRSSTNKSGLTTTALPVDKHISQSPSAGGIQRLTEPVLTTTVQPTHTTTNTTNTATATNYFSPTATTSSTPAVGMWVFTRAAPAATSQSAQSTTADPCMTYTDDELFADLRERGTYNPDLMAYNLEGILRFLRRRYGEEATNEQPYAEDVARTVEQEQQTVRRNLFALEKLLKDLKVNCNVRSSETIAQLYNLTYSQGAGRLRLLNQTKQANDIELQMQSDYAKFVYRINNDQVLTKSDDDTTGAGKNSGNNEYHETMTDGVLGTVHRPTNLCKTRGSAEDGFLRLCSACDAIRTLPDNYFPRQLFETVCDTDRTCLTFKGLTMGKCRQRQLNFIVLRNSGTRRCQRWEKYHIPVRVSCECFVEEMSWLAPYV